MVTVVGSVVQGCLTITACLAVGVLTSKQLPKDFEPCHKNDPNINACIKKSIESIIKHISNGWTDLHLPALDPVDIPFLEIQEGGDSDVYLDLTLRHTKLYGLSNTNILTVRSNLIDKKVELVCKYPHLDMIGDFVSDGAVLAIPLMASGGYSINMSDVTAIWIVYMNRSDLNGTGQLSIGEIHVTVIPASVAYDFGTMLDDDNDLGTAMQQFLNENTHEIFNAMKTKIEKILSEIHDAIGSGLLAQFSAEVLLPD